MLLRIAILLAFLGGGVKGAKPCRANHPTTETTTEPSENTTVTSLTSTTTTTTTEELSTVSRDPTAPCMAAWENIKSDDSSYADYALATRKVASVEKCGEECEKEVKCAFSFYQTSGNCLTFERFFPMDFVKNGDMTLVFKLYLNGTTTCETATMDGLASSKEKMYYPDGGSYWLFNGVMDTVGYASLDPKLGYKRRRKRSILGWLFNF